jgi:hypothetical protein
MRLALIATSFAVLLVACSKYALAPQPISVLYSNPTNATFAITWLSPGSASQRFSLGYSPGGTSSVFYGSGFRTDTVRPNQVTCEHFEMRGDQLAVEWSYRLPGNPQWQRVGMPDEALTWHSETSWGFDGHVVAPVGQGGVVGGC